ncbi:B-type cyclin [Batrachochytrium dendrobatidis]|nr:B-type cyclin [Batrachochytrium dendrobatidis]KAK5670109.1 B-type cyclin [Batrachochytrium dendrobatidis]
MDSNSKPYMEGARQRPLRRTCLKDSSRMFKSDIPIDSHIQLQTHIPRSNSVVSRTAIPKLSSNPTKTNSESTFFHSSLTGTYRTGSDYSCHVPVKRVVLDDVSNRQPDLSIQSNSKRTKRVQPLESTTKPLRPLSTTVYAANQATQLLNSRSTKAAVVSRNDVLIAKQALRLKEREAAVRARTHSRPIVRSTIPMALADTKTVSTHTHLPSSLSMPTIKADKKFKVPSRPNPTQHPVSESTSFSESVSSTSTAVNYRSNKYAHVQSKVNSWANSSVGSNVDTSGTTLVSGSFIDTKENSDLYEMGVNHKMSSRSKKTVLDAASSCSLVESKSGNPVGRIADEDAVMEEISCSNNLLSTQPSRSQPISCKASSNTATLATRRRSLRNDSAFVEKSDVHTLSENANRLAVSAKRLSQKAVLTEMGQKLNTKTPQEMVNRLNSLAGRIPRSVSAPCAKLHVHTHASSAMFRSSCMATERDSNILLVSEYAEEIYQHLMKMEIHTMPTHINYMDTIQPSLEWHMRTKLLCWIVQVHNRFRLMPETLFLTVNIIDRFLSLKQVLLEKLQLVGVTALLIASKYEDRMAPAIGDLVYMVDNAYLPEEILQAERYILGMLQYELGYPGPYGFMRRVSAADGFNSRVRGIAKYFLEVAILDQRLLKHKSSILAASAMLLARKVAHDAPWTSEHVRTSGYTEKELLECVYTILEDVRIVGRIAFKRESGESGIDESETDVLVVYDKYATERYGSVSQHITKFLHTMGLN